VFDTVAALGHKFLGPALVMLGIVLLVGLHFGGKWLEPTFPWAGVQDALAHCFEQRPGNSDGPFRGPHFCG
jgi:hypothetical protein